MNEDFDAALAEALRQVREQRAIDRQARMDADNLQREQEIENQDSSAKARSTCIKFRERELEPILKSLQKQMPRLLWSVDDEPVFGCRCNLPRSEFGFGLSPSGSHFELTVYTKSDGINVYHEAMRIPVSDLHEGSAEWSDAKAWFVEQVIEAAKAFESGRHRQQDLVVTIDGKRL